MKSIAIIAKKNNVENYKLVFKNLFKFFSKLDKEIYWEKHIADVLCLKKYKEFYRSKTKVDLVLVLGGDGTILHLIRKMKSFNTKIFGINIGHLGFLSESAPMNLEAVLNQILSGDYSIDKRSMLIADIIRNKKIVKSFHSLNEVVFSQASLARLIRLKTRVNNKKLTTYHADGLIISTATGSTAYNLSAGGPILHPSLDAFILTPLAPHSFTQKPIVLPSDKKISVKIENENKKIILTIDGQESFSLLCDDKIIISKYKSVQFIRLYNNSFIRSLRTKLNWGPSFK